MIDDELMRELARLRSREPDAEWAQRVRERCHESLAHGARKAEPKPRRIGLWEAATLAALCLYLTGTLEQTARLLGLR